MSSGAFGSTLDLRPAPSVRALRWIYLIHIAALTLIAFAAQPGYPMLGLALLLGVSWWSLRRHAVFGFGPRALTRLLWQPGIGWKIWCRGGDALPAVLLDDSILHPRLLVLNFRVQDGDKTRRRSRALLGDELPEESIRRLRAHLRNTGAGDDASGSGGPA